MSEVKVSNIKANSNGNGRGNGRAGVLNKDDLEQIYKGNSRRMFVIAYNILYNVEDAEDALQLAFLKLTKYYSQFNGKSKLSTYLNRIIVNESLMMLRPKERKVHKVSLEQECEDGSILILEIPDAVDCRNQYINRINIERAVSNLPNGQRKIWILYDYLGCKHWEIAQTLGCSLGNAKSQLHKARGKLRRALSSEQKKDSHLHAQI